MLRRITASVKIQVQRGRSFLKVLSEQVQAPYDEGNRLRNALNAPPLALDLAKIHFSHRVSRIACERITLSQVRVESENGAIKKLNVEKVLQCLFPAPRDRKN